MLRVIANAFETMSLSSFWWWSWKVGSIIIAMVARQINGNTVEVGNATNAESNRLRTSPGVELKKASRHSVRHFIPFRKPCKYKLRGGTVRRQEHFVIISLWTGKFLLLLLKLWKFNSILFDVDVELNLSWRFVDSDFLFLSSENSLIIFLRISLN